MQCRKWCKCKTSSKLWKIDCKRLRSYLLQLVVSMPTLWGKQKATNSEGFLPQQSSFQQPTQVRQATNSLPLEKIWQWQGPAVCISCHKKRNKALDFCCLPKKKLPCAPASGEPKVKKCPWKIFDAFVYFLGFGSMPRRMTIFPVRHCLHQQRSSHFHWTDETEDILPVIFAGQWMFKQILTGPTEICFCLRTGDKNLILFFSQEHK